MATQLEIRERRQKVLSAYAAGLKTGAIADLLGLHAKTVQRDIAALKKVAREGVDRAARALHQLAEAGEDVSRVAGAGADGAAVRGGAAQANPC